jgi:hypothetical protein
MPALKLRKETREHRKILSKTSTHTTQRSLCDAPFCNPKDGTAANVNGYTAGDGSPGKVVSEGALLALGKETH